MRKHKLWVLLIGISLIFGLGLWQIKQHYYGGQLYYTQIISQGTKIVDVDDSQQRHIDYQYRQTAINEQGQTKRVTFNGNKSRPLKKGAYLALTVNTTKGVTTWRVLAATEVPQKARTQLKEVL